jgi:hypothetical protein
MYSIWDCSKGDCFVIDNSYAWHIVNSLGLRLDAYLLIFDVSMRLFVFSDRLLKFDSCSLFSMTRWFPISTIRIGFNVAFYVLAVEVLLCG